MSTDSAWALLAQALGQDPQPALLILDEQFPGHLAPRPGLQALSNRCDVAAASNAADIPCTLNDFEFAAIAPMPARIYYRISKEKVLVNHVIDSALAALPPDGQLVLVGGKNEGIRGYAKNIAALGADVSEKKGPRSNWLVRVSATDAATAQLDREDYPRLRTVTGADGETFYSKPGIFGWNKIDPGSALLVSQLPAQIEQCPVRDSLRVLDLGCGYGYLSMALATLADCEIIATDNNAGAVIACEENFARRDISGSVVLADCAAGIDGRFDLLLCNPPFHRGFSVQGELIDRFLAAAATRIADHGSALFVTHSTAQLQRRAAPLFAHSEVLADDNRFAVTRLAHRA